MHFTKFIQILTKPTSKHCGRILTVGPAVARMAEQSEEIIHLTAEDIVEAFKLPLTVGKRKTNKAVPTKYNGRKIIRVASYNMLSFTKQKAANPGVREVICMTILENGYVWI